MSIKRRGNLSSSRQPGIDPKIQYELSKLKRSVTSVTFGDQFPPNPQVGDMHFYEGIDTDEFKNDNWYNAAPDKSWKSMSGASVEGTAIRGSIPTGVKIADYLALAGGQMIGNILFASTQKIPGDKIEGQIQSGVTIADYLPLIGGQLTGNLDMSRKNISRINKLFGYDTDIYMDMGVDNLLRLYADLIRLDNHVTIGNGAVGVDYQLAFDGETNDGLITWMEDENYFLFANHILVNDAIKHYFGTGVDMSIDYDGTQGNIKTNLVTPSDLHVNCGTDKTIVLDETVWSEMGSFTIFAKTNGSNYLTFQGNISEYVLGVNDSGDLPAIEILHDWKEGTPLSIHVHWATRSTNVGVTGVKWQIEYTVANTGTVFPITTIISAEDTVPGGTAALTHRFLFIGNIITTGLHIGAQLKIQVKRIASANPVPSQSPYFMALGIHYEKDTLGSRQIATK